MRDKVYEQATSDAEAIAICLGPLAVFATHAEKLARCGAEMAALNPEMQTSMRDNAAAALKLARERLAQLVEDFGDFFNGGDACSATMEQVTGPMYDVLRKRAEGVSLDD